MSIESNIECTYCAKRFFLADYIAKVNRKCPKCGSGEKNFKYLTRQETKKLDQYKDEKKTGTDNVDNEYLTRFPWND